MHHQIRNGLGVRVIVAPGKRDQHTHQGRPEASKREAWMQVAYTFATPSVYEHSEGRSSLLLDDLMLRLSKLLLSPRAMLGGISHDHHSGYTTTGRNPTDLDLSSYLWAVALFF